MLELFDYDAIVIGGGPAGSAAAITVSMAGLRTLLLERSIGETFRVGEGLPPDARRLLDTLGALARFEADGHLPSYGTESAWGSGELASNDSLVNPYGSGRHLDRARFDASLRERAREVGAQVWEGARPLAVERRAESGWELRIAYAEGTRDIAARWLVDASGRSAWLGVRVGARRNAEDLLLGIVALFGAQPDAEDRDTITLVEATEHGWWYTARIPNGRRVAVFHTDPDSPVCREAQTVEGFHRLLEQTTHIRARLHAYHSEPLFLPRATLANSSRLSQPCGRDWIAAGDAAAAYDPLSSQGIVSALSAGCLAGQAIVRTLAGEAGALARYAVQINRLYADYLQHRALYYRQERRWPNSPFWQRRRGKEPVLKEVHSSPVQKQGVT